MGIRDNNGVASRVTHDAGRGSENRGGNQAGKMGREGGLEPSGGEMNESIVSQNMAAITGAKGSSGTVKNNGGIGEINDQAGMTQKVNLYDD